MLVNELFAKHNPDTSDFIARLAAQIASQTRFQVGEGRDRAIVMWGGGKDSTLALAILVAVSERIPLDVTAVTMDNPGISEGTRSNIDRISERLQIDHQFWHFSKPVSKLHTADEDWNVLYRAIFLALGGSPRFMCIACNLASLVTEYAAVSRNNANLLATGNPAWELDLFATWLKDMKSECDVLNFPEQTGSALLDYYRSWHVIYSQLLRELFPVPEAGLQTTLSTFLYEMPGLDSPTAHVNQINAMGDLHHRCSALEHRTVLGELGWQFPSDILGGTESDCTMPAVITALNIQRKSLSGHLEDIKDAERRFNPLPEMTSRAVEWSVSGRAGEESQVILKKMGLSEQRSDPFNTRVNSPVAQLLLDKLFKIR